MKLKTVTDYLWDLQHERQHWLTIAERRRAFRLACILTGLVSLSVLLWILYR